MHEKTPKNDFPLDPLLAKVVYLLRDNFNAEIGKILEFADLLNTKHAPLSFSADVLRFIKAIATPAGLSIMHDILQGDDDDDYIDVREVVDKLKSRFRALGIHELTSLQDWYEEHGELVLRLEGDIGLYWSPEFSTLFVVDRVSGHSAKPLYIEPIGEKSLQFSPRTVMGRGEKGELILLVYDVENIREDYYSLTIREYSGFSVDKIGDRVMVENPGGGFTVFTQDGREYLLPPPSTGPALGSRENPVYSLGKTILYYLEKLLRYFGR